MERVESKSVGRGAPRLFDAANLEDECRKVGMDPSNSLVRLAIYPGSVGTLGDSGRCKPLVSVFRFRLHKWDAVDGLSNFFGIHHTLYPRDVILGQCASCVISKPKSKAASTLRKWGSRRASLPDLQIYLPNGDWIPRRPSGPFQLERSENKRKLIDLVGRQLFQIQILKAIDTVPGDK